MSITQQPLGSPTDPLFTDTDLLDIARELRRERNRDAA